VPKKPEVPKIEDKRLLDYELIFIVSPELDDEALESRIEGISNFITGRDGIISDTQHWGKKKLAYPLKHFLEGSYILTRFKISPARCKELEANLKISEEILRHLLIRVNN
jgi:small subunit ribosomal protein S6